MITLHDVMQLKCMRNFELIAGPSTFNQPIINVAIMDYEPLEQNYEVFLEHEFVLTSMLFAKDDPKLGLEALHVLIQRGISAIAIKDVFFESLDEKIKQEALQSATSIFVYHEIYMEEIICEIKDLLRNDADELQATRLITQLVHPESVISKRHLIQEIIPHFSSTIQCILVKPDCRHERLYVALNQMRKTFIQAKIYLYRSQILLITDGSLSNELLLRQSPITCLACGCSEQFLQDQLDLAILQATHALDYALSHQQQSCSYEVLNHEAFSYAIQDHALIQHLCNQQLQKIKKYDEENHTVLFETAKHYIANHGDVKTCSQELFQHQNTIRYRIAKIKSLLDKDEMEEKAFYEYLYLIIFLSRVL